MPAVDFEAWAIQPLVIELRGREYRVPPPQTAAAGQILAAAVRGEVNLGIAPGPVPDEVTRVLAEIKPDEHPALGPVYQQMLDDGIDETTIDRVAYYAVFYWAKGKDYADALATILWTPRDLSEAGEEAGPKGS